MGRGEQIVYFKNILRVYNHKRIIITKKPIPGCQFFDSIIRLRARICLKLIKQSAS